ncbi:MAG: helix-turn-helix domain-containing protein [Halanaeroarchaeum sp.]
MGDRRPSEAELISLLEDDYAREILVHTYEEARSADDLSDVCDADPSTIYRRVERLRDRDLIKGRQRIDPNGHHYEVFRARLRTVTIELTGEGYVVEVDRSEPDAADRFTRLYEELSG